MLVEEKEILRRVSEGDEFAFRKIFSFYYPKVLTFLRELIDNAQEVEDLSQNVFVKIWLMRTTLPEIKSFGAYMYRMARNAALDYCRRHKVNMPLSESYDDSYVSEVDEEFFAREAQAQMERRLASLPEKRREVFRLSRTEGLSNEEISEKLGISKKTVENHINHVLKDLRKITSCIAIFF